METQYLKIGTSLQNGTYTILGVLGQGGFGITYKAMMKETASGRLGTMEIDVPVAIKEFFVKDICIRNDEISAVSAPSTGSKAMVKQYRRKFVKEANNLADLSHPSIVKVIDVFQENGTDYYVMEYLEGGSLMEYINRNGTVDEPTALRFVNQIGQALNYMHTQKHMCHYDVKPGNILIDKKGDARLIDFGISKGYDESGLETSSTPIGIRADA
jgi:serine/threonine-protein kinase